MIRAAVVEDAPRLAEIHIASWQAAYAGLLPADYLDGLTDGLERRIEGWRGLIEEEGRHVLVAADGDELIGFSHAAPSSDDDLDPATTAELVAMYLDPSRYRRGWGSQLMEATFGYFRSEGLEEAALWVMRDNDAARSFYERHGWKPDGTESDLCLGITIPSIRYRVQL